MPVRDRAAAGARLAERLAAMDLESPVVLALPGGGVPVAAEIAAQPATHLFEEPGALDKVGALAAEWFTTHLAGVPASRGAGR